MGLTDAGITVRVEYGEQVDTAPIFLTTPNPQFEVGVPLTYPFAQDISDDGLSPVTYSLSNQLPDGLNYGTDTGILSYDGIAHVPDGSVSSHQLTVTDAVGNAVSDTFNITISPVLTIAPIPTITLAVSERHDMSQYISGTYTTTSMQGLGAVATYDPNTEELIGVEAGTEALVVTLTASDE
jgi:hypothetical protein